MAEKAGTPAYSDKLFYRSLDLDLEERGLDTENRTLDTLSFSSEAPVERWFGTEILSHEKGAADLSGLSSVLFNHNANTIVGPVTRKAVEDARGRAAMKFDDTDEGERAMKQVSSGSLRGVSVGYSYRAADMRELGDEEEFQLANGMKIKGSKTRRIFVIKKWRAHEISLTPIPADSTVGIGRDATRSIDGSEEEKALFVERIDNVETAPEQEGAEQGGAHMDPKEFQERLEKALAERDERNVAIMKRVFERAAAVGQESLAFRLFAEGKDENEITDAVFAEVAKERGQSTPPDGENEEIRTVPDVEKVESERLLDAFTNPVAFELD